MKKLIWISVLFFLSCGKPKPQLNEPELMNYIELEGRAIKVVEDEYGNMFLKQAVSDDRFIYIPFTDVAEYENPGDTLHSFQAKSKSHGTR